MNGSTPKSQFFIPPKTRNGQYHVSVYSIPRKKFSFNIIFKTGHEPIFDGILH